jgi:hypothetical protein
MHVAGNKVSLTISEVPYAFRSDFRRTEQRSSSTMGRVVHMLSFACKTYFAARHRKDNAVLGRRWFCCHRGRHVQRTKNEKNEDDNVCGPISERSREVRCQINAVERVRVRIIIIRFNVRVLAIFSCVTPLISRMSST